MMKLKQTVMFLLLFLGLSMNHDQFSHAEAVPRDTTPRLNSHCEERTSPVPWKFCVFRTEGSSNPDIVYYFHGLGLDEKNWMDEFDFGHLVRKYWHDQRRDAPTVVSVSFGPLWLLVEKNELPDSGLMDMMTHLVIPELKRVLEKGEKIVEGREMLLGGSMGGFNATQLLFKLRDRFEKVALVCPALSSLSPFATEEEVKAFIARSRANPDEVNKAITLSRFFIPNEGFWNRISPLQMAQRIGNEKFPEIYLSASLQDDFGFYEGSYLFYRILQEKGLEIEWRPLSGRHCSVDIPSLGEFLTR